MEVSIVEEPEVVTTRKPIKCPRCGTVYWLLPGEGVYCKANTNSPHASNGICYLHIGRASDDE